jgi:hypothetical protein
MEHQSEERAASEPAEPTPAPVAQPKPAGIARVLAIAACGFASLIGVILLLAGLAIVIAHAVARDDDGYYTTATEPIRSNGFAVTTDNIDLGDLDWAPEEAFASLQISAEGSTDRPIFLGIGRTADVDAYLRGVARSRLADFRSGEARYEELTGRPPTGRPAAQDIWVATASGSGEQAVRWDLAPGEWTAVAMNADASRTVAVDASIGAKVSWLIWVGLGLTLLGALLIGGMVLLVIHLSRARRPDPNPA